MQTMQEIRHHSILADFGAKRTGRRRTFAPFASHQAPKDQGALM